MLIYISGIEGIPQDLYEAATIDGAGKPGRRSSSPPWWR